MNTITKIKKQIVDIKTYGFSELFRKLHLLIKIFIRIPIDIVAILPCLIIRLISPWLIVRIQRLPAENFGEFVWRTSIYSCKKKYKIDSLAKKYVDLLYIHHNTKVYNKQIAKMWKRKFNFFSSYLLDPINRVNKLIPGWKKYTIDALSIRENDINNLFEKCQPLDFTSEEEIYGKKILSKFGLKDTDKFVCLAVRDGEYQLKKLSARYRNWSYHDYRHTDIDKFILAAEEITKRGYYVFRMGVVVEKKFNLENPKIIDYANSKLRSDFMDIYLGAKCSFCVSTGFGFDRVPYVFAKPLVLLTQPLGWTYSHSEKFLLMTKHHFLKKEKRELSLSEIFKYGLAYIRDTKILEKKGIELVDLSSEEIKDAVIEMIENLKPNKHSRIEDEELQKTFKNLYAYNIKRNNDSEEKNDYFYRFRNKLHGQIRSRYSTKFLRENKNWLR